jgi:predicted dehydrogenase
VKLRGAISGFGEVAARGHLPGWLTREDVSLVAIHEPVAERRQLAMRMLKTARIYDDLDLMLDGEAPDFLDIASPPALHAESVRAALEAGVHVLCEKPLCLDRDAFDRLTKLAAERSRILMCVHNWKHGPAFEVARHALESGRLGALRFISIDRLRTEPAGGAGKWRSDIASGGGILIDHGWHAFYLAQWLMGDAPLSVSAHLARQNNPGLPDGGLDGGLDDLADIRVLFPHDRLARIHLSWRAPVRRTLTTLYGDRAMLEIEGDRVIVTERSGSVEDLTVPDAPDDSYHSTWFGKVAEDFQRAIGAGVGSPVAARNLLEARTALRLIVAARESASTGGSPIQV